LAGSVSSLEVLESFSGVDGVLAVLAGGREAGVAPLRNPPCAQAGLVSSVGACCFF